MGLFDGLKYGKAASELGLTVEQYKEFLQYQQSDELTIEEYRYYLKKYAGKKSMRWFIDQVLYAPTEQQKPKEPQVKKQEEKPETWMPKEQIEEEEIWQPEELDPKFTIENGVLLKIEIPEGCKKVVIPEGVTEIAAVLEEEEEARIDIEFLKLPSTLKKIGDHGLSGFASIMSIELPEGLEVIDSWGLAHLCDVKGLVLPSTVRYVGKFGFYDNGFRSIEIRGSNAKIFNNAFVILESDEDEEKLHVTLPRQLAYFAEYVMMADKYAVINYIDVPQETTDELPEEPDFVIKEGILESVFIPANSKQISIPEGVTEIADQVFMGTTMESVILPGTLREIGNEAFGNCRILKTISLPEGLKRIRGRAFKGCVQLTSITLPKSLEKIEWRAFGNCTKLKAVNVLCADADIEGDIFSGCTDVKLTALYEAHRSVQKVYNPSANMKVIYLDAPEKQETQFDIQDSILKGWDIPVSKRIVAIPEGVTEFAPIFGFEYYISTIVLPASMQRIQRCRFGGYKSLKRIVVLNPEMEEFDWEIFKNWKGDLYLPYAMREKMAKGVPDGINVYTVDAVCRLMMIEDKADVKKALNSMGIFDEEEVPEAFEAPAVSEGIGTIAQQQTESPRRRRRQQMPAAQMDTQTEETPDQPTVQPVNCESAEEMPVIEHRRRRRQIVQLDADATVEARLVSDTEAPNMENTESVAEEPATAEITAAKPAGVRYAVGQEPDNIRTRLDRLFEKLDSAYPDKVIIALAKNHGHWAESVTELYRLLGYPDSWSFLEAYGYQVKVNEENGKGGRPVKDRTAVIDELKRRYPRPVEGSVAFLMEQNPDLAPRIKTLQNSAQTVFGMRLADYLKQEGILAEKKVEPKIEKPVVKQLTPEEKLEQIISELKRRYPTLKSAPKSLAELKEKNADLPMATLNTLTQKVVQKTAGEYCLELGLICDKERMKKDALESAADGRDGWGRQFTQTILDRGVNMFVAGEVKSLDRTADGYAAKVKGTSMYSVRIETAGDEVRSMSCTCPYAADGLNCKHMAAVLFEANAKLYAPKVKKPQPIYGHATNAVSRSCADNEILIVSKDEAVLRAAVNCSYIDSDSVSIQPCSVNPAYYLCEVRIDERRINLCGLMDMVICPMLDGRGVALGRKVDNEHEVSDIGFYDGECLWAGSEFDLMYPDSDAPDEPEEWVYECNSKKNRTWGQSKKVWKKIWNKIPYYTVRDLIATYEENCMPTLTSAKESSKVSRDADRRCEPGELLIVSNYYDGIEQIVYEQEEIEPKNGIRQCTKSPDTWYAVFDLEACADVEETLNALLDMIEGDMIILARWKDETGSNRVWFFDSDNLWTNMLEEDLAKNKDPQEEFDRYHQEICGIRDEEQTEAMWRYVRSRLLGMTTVDWAHFIETYSTEEDE